jgi:AAA+ ATPase superfamily predicted ATPase
MPKTFIGRGKELEKLSQLTVRSGAKLIVIKGRRRIGKSRLLAEFGNYSAHFSFGHLLAILNEKCSEKCSFTRVNSAFSSHFSFNLA